jgi:HlyD family secretion protein
MQDQIEEIKAGAQAGDASHSPAPVPAPQHLPVPVRRNGKRRGLRITAALLLVALGAGGAG